MAQLQVWLGTAARVALDAETKGPLLMTLVVLGVSHMQVPEAGRVAQLLLYTAQLRYSTTELLLEVVAVVAAVVLLLLTK
jgi:hypothetical protein